MPTFAPLVQRALQIAKQNLGKRETTGRNDGPFQRMLQRWVAKGAIWLDGQPWCVMFVTWCVHEAAKQLGIRSRLPVQASSSTLYRWFRANGLLLSRPVGGCIGMARGGKTGHYHSFFVHEVRGNVLVTVEGNYRNTVTWSNHRKVSDCDFGRIV